MVAAVIDGLLELRDVEAARDRIAGRVHRTPMVTSATLGDMIGVRLTLKAELLQKTGSFKPRGVFSKLLSLSTEELARGLVSISAGNHAAALAYGAAQVGSRATIVMPAAAMRSKIEATRAYGGEVVLTEGDLLEECLRIQEARGSVLVHPFDDLLVMAGQGTVGLEIVEDLPGVEVVVVPVGGGGLISGIGAAVKGLRPGVSLIGVEPEASDAMSRSLSAGEPVQIGRTSSVADGLTAPFGGRHTLPHVQRFVDQLVRVGEDEILSAWRLLLERSKLAAEPSGAVGLAALLSGAVELPEGARVVAVVTGGNFDLDTLRRVL
jgi:threonine dehydratase